jgi:outer membrane protein assembly factor BamB
LYGLGPRKNLICVEVATGKQKWSQEGYIQTSADKAHAAFLAMGSNILCLTDNGQLVLFRADPEKFQELGTLQVAGVNWCNPAYADGKLYLRDGVKGPGDLICADLRTN